MLGIGAMKESSTIITKKRKIIYLIISLSLFLLVVLFFVLYQIFIPNPDEKLAWNFFFTSIAFLGLLLILSIIFLIDVLNRIRKKENY
jgi:hypothetical protein